MKLLFLIVLFMFSSVNAQQCNVNPFNDNKSLPVCTLKDSPPSFVEDFVVSIHYVLILMAFSKGIANILEYFYLLPEKPLDTFWAFWWVYYFFNINFSAELSDIVIDSILVGVWLTLGSILFKLIVNPRNSNEMFFYCFLSYLLI